MKQILLTLVLLVTACQLTAGGYRASRKCIDMVKQHEKCSLTAYWDVNGYSIGYGHHTSVKKGQKISQKQADRYLVKDIAEAEKYVNILLSKLPYKYKFSQGFIDGFVSFTYNVGYGNAKNSVFYSRLKRCRVSNGKMNKRDFDYACAGIKKDFTRYGGNKKRRVSEYKMISLRTDANGSLYASL